MPLPTWFELSALARALFPAGAALAILGCSSILSLEDRSLDESELDSDGYAGCVPGGDCDGCISDAHRRACAQGSTTSGGSSGNGGGSSSSSESASTSTSSNSGGASSVSTSVGGASNAGGGENSSTTDTSTDGISTTGGINFLGCGTADTDACTQCICDSCTSAVDQCQGDAGCLDIWSCFTEHACDPVEGAENSCFSPGTCLPAIENNGGINGISIGLVREFVSCAGQQCPCTGNSCTFEQGCQCDTCLDGCLCNGNDNATCQAACEPVVQPCGEAGTCDGCTSCLSTCLCLGSPESQCLAECGLSSCDGSATCACGSAVEQCLCDGNAIPEECAALQLGLSCYDYFAPSQFASCDTCACTACPAVVSLCETSLGSQCTELLACMGQTGCAGDGCNMDTTCASQLTNAGGLGSPAAELAEAVMACRRLNGCIGCPVPPPPPVMCGGVECYGYMPPPDAPIAAACCGGMNQDICGFNIDAYWPTPSGECIPAWQPGTADPSCPGAQTSHPYHSMWLDGCCRPDGTCGLQELEIGLGCVPAPVVGMTPGPVQTCAVVGEL